MLIFFLKWDLTKQGLRDRLTEKRGSIRSVIVGLELRDELKILPDNEVLLLLNNLLNNFGRRFSFDTQVFQSPGQLLLLL